MTTAYSQQAARLFYLAQELRSPIPANLVKYLRQGEILQGLASYGVSGLEQGLGIERKQLQKLIDLGAKEGKATREEWKFLVTSLITEELIAQKDSMKLADYIGRSDALSRWMNGSSSLINSEEGTWEDDGEMIAKWDIGFPPFDMIFEGFYQGLFTIMGSTGTGKTTHMLALAEQFRRTKRASEVWFFQTEIPQAMFKYRMRPISQRTKFIPGKDRIFYGHQSIAEIIEMCKSNPDPNRVIFHDSPDVLAGGSAEEGRRFELESLFRDLVILKSLCKAVFVASQVRRKDRRITIASGSESWAKAWYADGIIGLQKMGFTGENALMKAVVVKNRFGPVDFEINYEFDQVEIKGTLGPKSKKRAAGWTEDDGENPEAEGGW